MAHVSRYTDMTRKKRSEEFVLSASQYAEPALGRVCTDRSYPDQCPAESGKTHGAELSPQKPQMAQPAQKPAWQLATESKRSGVTPQFHAKVFPQLVGKLTSTRKPACEFYSRCFCL